MLQSWGDRRLMKLWVALYIASIVLVNWLFAPAQLVQGITVWDTAFGSLYLANLVVGFVFVLLKLRACAHKPPLNKVAVCRKPLREFRFIRIP